LFIFILSLSIVSWLIRKDTVVLVACVIKQNVAIPRAATAHNVVAPNPTKSPLETNQLMNLTAMELSVL